MVLVLSPIFESNDSNLFSFQSKNIAIIKYHVARVSLGFLILINDNNDNNEE